jgi:hypothetical protein
MISKIIIASLIWIYPVESYGQGTRRIIYGVVTDSQTTEPIPYVYVETSSQATVTNHLGMFSIYAGEKEVIVISHVAYHQLSLSVKSAINDSINVAISPKDKVLKEVVITEFRDLDLLKKEILELEIAPIIEEVNAERNIENSKVMYRMGYKPPMSSYDNYRSFMKGPLPVTFFSSDPSKGLIRAIKNMNQRTLNLLFRPKRTYINKDFYWPDPYLIKPDTIKKY